jgi:hypothetical protein
MTAPDDYQSLLSATPGELYSLLGASALAVENPTSVLKLGREGSLWQGRPAVLGTTAPFEHAGFQVAAKSFLKRWHRELQSALCGNQKLYAEEQKRGIHDIDLLIASIVGAITASVPALAPFVPLVTVLAVLVVKTGLRSFCDTLGELV